MSDTVLFLWGSLAFLLAVGPLIGAAFLDYRERSNRHELERSAGFHDDQPV